VLRLLFFLEARDLINRITQGLMKSELPSHRARRARPLALFVLRKNGNISREYFSTSIPTPLPPPPFALPRPVPLGESRGPGDSGREINSEIDKSVSTNFSSRPERRDMGGGGRKKKKETEKKEEEEERKNELLRRGAYYRKIIGRFLNS